ncbi:MAG: sigma-70 family RNA polymerase sigma factor [Succiniclasticum sp.]|nr:sigma-70 family RNA polymerase sigma factor [Succiniclasticum sp.]
MKRDNRAAALRKLENIAKKEKELWYRRICDYALAYRLTVDDRIWLYNKLKAKGVTILGMDPTTEPESKRKIWYDEDGTEYFDFAHKDYETVYEEIVRKCNALRPLVDKVRTIKPPQRHEIEHLNRKISEGDEGARERLIDMYLRTALAFGLRWSKLMDVDLQEAIGDALEGLVKAVNSYSPDKGNMFSMYLFGWMRHTTSKGQTTHDPQVSIKKDNRFNFVSAYCVLKKWGCLGCDKLADCDKVVQTVAERLNWEMEDAQAAIRASLEPLSLEACLETAEHTISEGFCEDIREEVDDAPDYEEELSGYCVDAEEEAETGLTGWLLQEKLKEQMNQLTPREKEVLEYHNGIGCRRPYTLEEIGYKYGVSRARIQQIETTATDKLRTRSKVLKDYLSDKQSDRDKNMMQNNMQAGGMHMKKEMPNIRLRRNIMNLSELLVYYRTEHNLDRREMAELCEISETTLSRLEEPDNVKCPASRILLKLFKNMEITEDVFMDVIKHDSLFRGLDIAWMWEDRNEERLLDYYRQMNKHGKEIALAQVQVLAESRKF